MVNVGKIYSRKNKCLGFLLQLEIVKNLLLLRDNMGNKCLGFLLQLEIVKNLLLLRDNMGNSRISRAPIFTMNNPPFQVFSTLLWGVKNLRASPSGFLLPRAKCKKPEMGGYLLSKFIQSSLNIFL